jgi:ComF family protein
MSSRIPTPRVSPRARILSALRTLLRAILATLGQALSPPTCAACDARLPRRATFCAPCAAEVSPAEAWPSAAKITPVEACGPDAPGGVLREAVAFGIFDGALARALRRFKYVGRPDLAVPLGQLAARAARRAGLDGDIVVPVPLHPCRLAERGYNQAALLAAEVATALSRPLAACALARTRHTLQQARLTRLERAGNVAAAFRVPRPRMIRGRRVILVDDVATTGATLGACREALLAAGAASVTVVVVARAA